MTIFWSLTETGVGRRKADWPEGEELDFEDVHCSVNPVGHRGVGERITPMSVALPDLAPQDFVWVWGGECLVQERVLRLFAAQRFTGYKALHVKNVKFAEGSRRPPELWEVVVTGSGGFASTESGVRALKFCPGCGLADYSRVTDASKYIDLQQWDGSDFFRVKPVSGWIFVTDRVVHALRENKITGWRARPVEEMQADLNVALAGDSAAIH